MAAEKHILALASLVTGKLNKNLISNRNSKNILDKTTFPPPLIIILSAPNEGFSTYLSNVKIIFKY